MILIEETYWVLVGKIDLNVLEFRQVKWWLLVCGSGVQRYNPTVS